MLWEVQLCPVGFLCMAHPGIAPSSLGVCIPCALSIPAAEICQPFPPWLAQPLRILPPKRSWKTSSQLSLFMKA